VERGGGREPIYAANACAPTSISNAHLIGKKRGRLLCTERLNTLKVILLISKELKKVEYKCTTI